jgi:hypothetical protein
LAAGIGGSSASLQDSNPDVELSGGAGFFSFDLGGSLTDNLALHGRLAAHSIFEPTVTVGGDERGDLNDTTLSFSMLAIGLTYYFPINLYITGVLGLASARLDVDGREYDSDVGLGVGVDVGYEWEVGGDWGIGVAGRLELYSVGADDDSDNDTIGAGALGVLFSATYY